MAETQPYMIETKKLIEPIISKPKLTEKLLEKPPFKFLHDVTVGIIKATGTFSDLYSEQEMDAEYVIKEGGKEGKTNFLNKLIEAVASKLGEPVPAKSGKILAGAEPENTNLLLQQLARAAKSDSSGGDAESAPKKKKKVVKKSASEDAPPPTEESPAPKKKKKVVAKESTGEEAESTPKKKKAPAKSEGGDEKPKKKAAAKSEGGDDATPKKKKKKADGEAPTKKTKAKGDAPVKKKKAAPKPEPQEEPRIPEPVAEEVTRSAKKPEPNLNNFAMDSNTDITPEPQNDNISALERQTGRPQSARAPPPKISTQVKAVDKVQIENVIPINNNTILTEGKEDDEEQLDLGDDDEEEDQTTQNVDISSVANDGDMHGGLVRDIIAANKTIENGDQPNEKKEKVKVEVLANKHQKEVLQKEVTKVRESIQIVCRSANPLGKNMDYIQEDFENMGKEYEKWKHESATQQAKLKEEKRVTEASLQPLNQRLSDIDKQIIETMQKIHIVKTTVSKNDEMISKMLSLVVN